MATWSTTKFASLATNELGSASSSYVSWADVTNALTNNSAWATATISTTHSRALFISNFGFEFPADAVITGMEITVRGRTSSTNRILVAPRLSTTSLGVDTTGNYIWSGTTWYSNITLTSSNADFTVGTTTARWNGSTWSSNPSVYSSSNFGIVVQSLNKADGTLNGTGTISIDSVSVVITYTSDIGPGGLKALSSTIAQTTKSTGKLKRARRSAFQSNEFLAYIPFMSKDSGPATAGPRNPTTSSGTGWSNVANIYAQDSAVATITPVTSGSAPLKAQGFGFSIPSDATINGITFEAYAYKSGGAGGEIDVQVKALKENGATSATSVSTTAINGTPSYKTYGSSTSLWGETWTPADINDVNFGVQLTPTATGGGVSSTTSSYTNPAAAVSVAGSGGANWVLSGATTLASAVGADGDGKIAKAGGYGSATASMWPTMNVTNFGFALPSNATVIAVEVSVSRADNQDGSQNSGVYWQTVQLIKGGSATGTNKGATTPLFPTIKAYQTFGNTTDDLWGNTLLYSDVNASNFGVSLRPRYDNSNAFPSNTVYVDHVRMRITYTLPSDPDRILNVDHVRATVHYTPVDTGVKYFSYSVAESSGAAANEFKRTRGLPTLINQSGAIDSAVMRARNVASSYDEVEDFIIALSRDRFVSMAFSIDEMVELSGALGRVRGLVAQVDITTDIDAEFARLREVFAPVSESVDVVTDFIRERGIEATAEEIIEHVISLSRDRQTKPVTFAIHQAEAIAAAIRVLRAIVNETRSPAASSEGSGVTGWQNIGNVYAQDGAVATIVPASSGNKPLRVQNFGFNLPPSTPISGVQFDVYAYKSGGTVGEVDVAVHLLKDGVASASSEALTSINSTPSYKTFGTTSSLWGETLTGADINDVDFGVQLTPTGTGGGTDTESTALTNPASAVSEGGISPWANPANVFTSNGAFAQSGGSSSAASNWPYLNVTDFGLNIPAGATINAIEVSVQARRSTTDTQLNFETVQLLIGGMRVGTRKTLNNISNTFTYYTFGDVTSDKWGLTPTAAQLNATDFGVSLRFFKAAQEATEAQVDHVRIRVNYTATTAPDRTLNIDHVRAIVHCHPLDIKSLGSILNAQLEMFSGNFARDRNIDTHVIDAEIVSSDIIRGRLISSEIAETQTIASSLNRARTLVASLAENIGYTFSKSRQRLLTQEIVESSGFSFGELRRARTIASAIVEALNYEFLVRLKGELTYFSASITQTQTVDALIGLTRSMVAQLEELQEITPQASRKRDIQATIAEVEIAAFTLAKWKFFAMATTQVSAIADITLVRGRGLKTLSEETLTVDASVVRKRAISPSIAEQTSVTTKLVRLREVMASFIAQEEIEVDFDRLRGFATTIVEQEEFGFIVAIVLIPENFTVSVTYYVNELLADGTINYKLKTDSWQIVRKSEMQAVLVPVASEQVIDVSSIEVNTIDINEPPTQFIDLDK